MEDANFFIRFECCPIQANRALSISSKTVKVFLVLMKLFRKIVLQPDLQVFILFQLSIQLWTFGIFLEFLWNFESSYLCLRFRSPLVEAAFL